MAGINGIDYSNWSNKKAVEAAQQSDKDGVKGLQGVEIFNFAKTAASDVNKDEIFSLLGLSISQTRAASNSPAHISRPYNPDFDKAVEFYNKDPRMTSYERYDVTRNANNNVTKRLYEMESKIDKAYMECAAFKDPNIMVVRMSPYRYYNYPSWYDRLLNFDIEKLRTQTTEDMDSLDVIKAQYAEAVAAAKGETSSAPEPNDYNVDEIAKKVFNGMSYQDFAKKYSKELENCKYVQSYADILTMDETQRYVYNLAKKYAAEMLDITTNAAHNTHWDIQEGILNESFKATEDIFIISEFERDGITEEGLDEIQSGIMYKAFEEALISKHRELDPTSGVEDHRSADKQQKTRKDGKNIYRPDGSVYRYSGQKIK